MKKLLCVLAAMVLVLFLFSACGDPTSGSDSLSGSGQRPNSGLDDNTPTPIADDVLVVYFSCTQTTEKIAGYVTEITGGSGYKLQPKVPYTEDDLKYYTDCRADKEQSDPNARPEIEGKIEDFEKYETVFIGYPIWHGKAPKIIYTFLESYDFKGKTIIPFCTSHSSGIGSSDKDLHPLAPDAVWKDGQRFAQDADKQSVSEWIDTLNISFSEESMQIYLTTNQSRLSVALEDNRATAELKKKLKTSAITINMSDYGGFEKVGGLGFSLPTDNRQITTKPLDVMLYQGNQMVIFYNSNSWSYTPIGKITGVTTEELKTILGSGNTTVTLSLN